MVLPLIIAGAVLGSLIIAGCSGSNEDDNPAGVPLPDAGVKKPQCDAFKKGDDYKQIDDRSFAALNYLWSGNPATSNALMWEPRSRIYIGAASDLLKPMCEEKDSLSADVMAYRKGAIDFLQQKYLSRDEAQGLALEQSILVLIDGLAPASLDANVVFGALDSLAGSGAAGWDFANVLKAGYHFNAAANHARASDRYAGATPAADLADTELAAAKGSISSALVAINKVVEQNLDDRQIEFLIALRNNINSLSTSLDKINIEPVDEGAREKTGKGGGGKGKTGKGGKGTGGVTTGISKCGNGVMEGAEKCDPPQMGNCKNGCTDRCRCATQFSAS